MVGILDRITEQRMLRNWTEYELAQRSALPQSTISSWYRKKMLHSLPVPQKIFHLSIRKIRADKPFSSRGNQMAVDTVAAKWR